MSKDMSTHHRRDFVRALALGASAVALPASASLGADEGKPKDEPKTTEADARMALVLARFGKQLDGPARASVRDEVNSHVRRAEALRKLSLDNGDGPFPVFHPYRAPLGDGKQDA